MFSSFFLICLFARIASRAFSVQRYSFSANFVQVSTFFSRPNGSFHWELRRFPLVPTAVSNGGTIGSKHRNQWFLL